MRKIEGKLVVPKDAKFGIVVSRFNELITSQLLGGAVDAPRRRLAVATYVLDMLKDVEDAPPWQDTQAAATLLEWGCARLRDSAPLAAELVKTGDRVTVDGYLGIVVVG